MLSAENRSSSDIKKFKHRHFERHTSTGSEIYSLLLGRYQMCLCSLLQRRSALKFGQNRCPRVQKKATSVDVRRLGTSWLKLVDMSYSFQSMCHLLNHLTHYLLVSFVVVYRRIQNTLSRTRLLNPPTLRHLHKFLVHHYQLRM